MSVVITKHARQRIKEGRITEKSIEKIVKKPDEEYYDNIKGSLVAVKAINYKGKKKNFSVFFHREEENIIVHTAHQERKQEIKNRTKKGRYTKR